jgi:hypothetical protein
MTQDFQNHHGGKQNTFADIALAALLEKKNAVSDSYSHANSLL